MCERKYWYTKIQYKNFQTFINPEICEFSEEKVLAWEGCISNDEHLCLVERPMQVRVKFQNLKGQEFDILLRGLVARIFQHELDHLEGQLMWERVDEKILSGPPRRLERMIAIKEVEANEQTFYDENGKYILEF